MEQIAQRLAPSAHWTYLGKAPGGEGQPAEVVLRAFEGDLLAATGAQEQAPDSDPVRVHAGAGQRLAGLHFFVRPAEVQDACLFSYRGL